MADDDTNKGSQPFHYEGGVPVFDVRRVDNLERAAAQAEARDTKYKDEQLELNREQLKVNKWMMRFNAALVVCTVITGGIAGYQAHVAKLIISEQIKWWNSEPEFPDFSTLPKPTPAQLVMPGIDKYQMRSNFATMDRFAYIGAYEQTGETRLYLLMKISYCDGFGNRYWTTMCISHAYGTKPKDMTFCAHGNDVGEDKSDKSCTK